MIESKFLLEKIHPLFLPMRIELMIFLLSFAVVTSAQKYNHQWLFGYDSFSGSNSYGLSVIDFNDGIVTIDFWSQVGHDLGPEGSFLDDGVTGEIILYTNGCRVWDANRNSLTGEDFLMDDWASPLYCPKEHPTRNARLLLPSLQNDTTVYLIQKDVNYSEEIGTVVSERLFIHTIIQSEDGVFFLQNTEVVLDTVLVIGHLTAGPNLARDKWWFSVTEHDTNRHFIYELGGEEVISEPIIHEEGSIATSYAWDVGQAAFSPDMSIWANNTEDFGIMLFDFDNNTGEFSNYREIHYPNMDTAEGLCFSPNGRYIYTTTAEDIYQIDLEAVDTSEQVHHLGYVRFPSPDDGWPVGLGYMYLGPDCRIYISPGTTSQYMHVIHNPDGYQDACLLDVGAILTPTHVGHHLPNLPNYYYLNGCDPDIAWGIPVSTAAPDEEEFLAVFPNPTRSKVLLQRPAGDFSPVRWRLFNAQGVLVREELLVGNQQEVDLNNLPSGTYFWRLENTTQMGRLVIFD
ncbi:MAG: T9SS type A sorting domain-containing protein [Lewinella sp.]|uniref:T9SS type A sorting domain-containing protein n=1 Tax=Lewinella sp. TaxID=2004506 RepID=UPI003D6BD387